MAPELTRRTFLGATAAATAAACAPATAPATQSQPAGAATGWEAEWQELVKAAKSEGKLTLVTAIGAGYRDAVAAFEDAFPGISVEHTSLNASNFTPRALQEWKSGIFSYDAMTSTWAIVPRAMADEGMVVPIKQVIFRPDVLDTKVWQDGFDAGYRDKDEKWVYAGFVERREDLWINTDMVQPNEIAKVEDLLNPKWKGKIVTGDPRAHGGGFTPGTILRMEKGDDFVKRLWKDQECAFSRDNRQLTEFMVRGRYAIGIGAVFREILEEFTAENLGKNLKRLDLESIDSVSGGRNNVWMFNKAPHPDAGKLFVNWLLSKEGSAIWSKYGATNSRRVDVPPAYPDVIPAPGKKYRSTDAWDMVDEFQKTQDLAKAVLN